MKSDRVVNCAHPYMAMSMAALYFIPSVFSYNNVLNYHIIKIYIFVGCVCMHVLCVCAYACITHTHTCTLTHVRAHTHTRTRI